jgi:hypothetical protein
MLLPEEEEEGAVVRMLLVAVLAGQILGVVELVGAAMEAAPQLQVGLRLQVALAPEALEMVLLD